MTGLLDKSEEDLKKRLQGWTARGLMRYTSALTSRDSSRRMHQAVFDKDKPRWALERSVFGYGMPHVEFHTDRQYQQALSLITVTNSLNEAGKVTSGGVPFTCVTEGDDILFMPRMDPVDLGKPFGSCFFAVMAGLPSWIIARVLSRDDFVHKMTFKVPDRRRRLSASLAWIQSVAQRQVPCHQLHGYVLRDSPGQGFT